MANTVLNRVVRRETHSPRTVVTVIVLVLVIAAAVYAGVEIVLRLIGSAPLLVSPGAALDWLIGVPALQPQGALVAGSVVVALVGIVLIWLALSPGRLPKHRIGDSRHAVVIDNDVIASAVAECVRRELDLPKNGVVVGVGHRTADVTVRPEFGREVDKARVRSVAQAEIAGYDLSPRLTVRARVQQRAERGGGE